MNKLKIHEKISSNIVDGSLRCMDGGCVFVCGVCAWSVGAGWRTIRSSCRSSLSTGEGGAGLVNCGAFCCISVDWSRGWGRVAEARASRLSRMRWCRSSTLSLLIFAIVVGMLAVGYSSKKSMIVLARLSRALGVLGLLGSAMIVASRRCCTGWLMFLAFPCAARVAAVDGCSQQD